MVSIIVNCHNGEQYLREALESIRRQTYTDYEIVFWDNCSTDNSVQIANGFGERIRVFRGGVFVGLGEARDLAIKQAQGEYIAFLDCDDLWTETKLEKQVQILDSNKEIDLITTNFIINNVTRGTKKNNDWDITKRIGGLHEVVNIGSISTSATMFRRSSIASYPHVFNSELKYTMDFELYTRIAKSTNVYFIKEPLTIYRIHKAMTTRKLHGLMYDEYNKVIDSIKENHSDFLQEHPEDILSLEYIRDFLEAKHLLEVEKREKARVILKKHMNKPKALVLYIIACLPFGSRLWNVAMRRR